LPDMRTARRRKTEKRAATEAQDHVKLRLWSAVANLRGVCGGTPFDPTAGTLWRTVAGLGATGPM
jgi:hypothetical protein